MKKLFFSCIISLFLVFPILLSSEVLNGDYLTGRNYRYAVIISSSTLNDSGWSEVVDSLTSRHSAQIFVYTSNVWEIQTNVSNYKPDYIAFVATVSEANASYVQSTFWPFICTLDSDPYPDAVSGIITGCDASDALRIVTGPPQIIIKTMLGGTASCNVNYFPQGISTSEGTYHRYYVKYPDSVKTVTFDDGPRDRTEWLVNMINGDSLIFGDSVDIFVTSGHGSSTSWQMHYPTPGDEGFFRSNGFGHLYGQDHAAISHDILTYHPKIYFGLGNCQIGKIDNEGCMAPAWIHSGGAYLYTGYVINEGSYSYHHGATKAYFCLQDHYSWPIAFMLANCSFYFDFYNNTPGIGSPPDISGSALYGDPAIDARIPEGSAYVYDTLLYTKELIVDSSTEFDTITFKITMNKEGNPGYTSKWGYRSPICLLPFRINPDSVDIIDTNADTFVIADNFILIYIWHQGQSSFPAGTERWVKFTTKISTGIDENEISITNPGQATILSSQPNPFSTSTTIRFFLNKTSPVSLKIYDQSGRIVRTLVDGIIEVGYFEERWDGRNDSGLDLPSGIYFYHLVSQSNIQTNKLLLVR